MDIERLAAIGVALAGACLVLVVRRGASAKGQAFSTQVGDAVFAGHYQVRDGVVHVTCEEGSKSGPLAGVGALHRAERLLAEIHAKAD